MNQPDGEVWTYYYDKASVWRLVASGTSRYVAHSLGVSSRGYALQFSYQADGVPRWSRAGGSVVFGYAYRQVQQGTLIAAGVRLAVRSFDSDAQTVDITYDRVSNRVRLIRAERRNDDIRFSLEPRWGALAHGKRGGDISATKRTSSPIECHSNYLSGGGSVPNPLTWLDNVEALRWTAGPGAMISRESTMQGISNPRAPCVHDGSNGLSLR